MIRVFVFKDRSDENGRVIVLDNSFEDLINTVKKHFCLEEENIKLYTPNGCEILDLHAIRDNEKLYITNNKKGNQNSEYDKSISDWIMLNVGGKHFMTSRSTLTSKFPYSMLARMFAENNDTYLMKPSAMDPNGAFLIDRSPEYFEPILNYMRHGQVILDSNVNPRGVFEEALYYGIDSMIPQLQELIDKMEATSLKSVALTRMDVVRSIIVTDTGSELRFQGVNLSGADLSRLDLRHINFKYANMSRCNLSGANLSNCCLERADLSHAILEGAQLLGVKALCANMEGAYMKSCNMEDPAGNRAVMEGVNLKGANLEGSNMAGVNMRVATLKNANLQNCDLRSAVLAGADLECCDLSGSDLHEANLRGANLKDAAFELMLTPLHMSQTVR